jgi:hypothetical protein
VGVPVPPRPPAVVGVQEAGGGRSRYRAAVTSDDDGMWVSIDYTVAWAPTTTFSRVHHVEQRDPREVTRWVGEGIEKVRESEHPWLLVDAWRMIRVDQVVAFGVRQLPGQPSEQPPFGFGGPEFDS